MSQIFDVDSDSVFLTARKEFKDETQLSDEDSTSFDVAKRDEIHFLFKDAVTANPLSCVPENVELHRLKWFIALKTSSIYDNAKSYRTCIVSCPH